MKIWPLKMNENRRNTIRAEDSRWYWGPI